MITIEDFEELAHQFRVDQGDTSASVSDKPIEGASMEVIAPEKEIAVNQFKCDAALCSKTFKTEARKMEHERKAHLGPGKYTCETCGHKNFYSKEHRNHMRSHKEPKTYICEVCCKKLRTSSSLKSHMKDIHTQTNPKCPKCKDAFEDKHKLRNHMKNCKTQGALTLTKRVKQAGGLKAGRGPGGAGGLQAGGGPGGAGGDDAGLLEDTGSIRSQLDYLMTALTSPNTLV